MVRVNVIGWDNGVGLARDMRLLADVLSDAGFAVTLTSLRRGKLRKWFGPPIVRLRLLWYRLSGRFEARRFDVNLMLEHVRPEFLPFARRNLLVPNPEWFDARDARHVGDIDLALTKTRHGTRVLAALGVPTRYIGFTSVDRWREGVQKEVAFFHLAGRSARKGTRRLIELWRRHPEWPLLTILQHPSVAQIQEKVANIDHRVDYLTDDELADLQNSHMFHLCPSETEGFGHYIAEAMSARAVTVTLDAEPMNELVQPERGMLVLARPLAKQNLAVTFDFDDAAMESTIEALRGMDVSQLVAMGRNARAWYEDNDESFRAAVVAAMRGIA
ncbi:glycosyl transferase family 1 [Luteimonas sp. SX5]|uniref:Glycosyl transferase family 1 n=1 Tax=Luteimonas galliterrae TaxID=2940486 RepID=A0ABT0MF93_9GAMM|nr:glycosyltransferase [Luteimonas galliterrae]MCL1633546.1 glycosyl transferase family 1 [Luteimonas galliterrae]